MKTINARNVNEAFALGMLTMSGEGVREVSPRGMSTLEWDGPVITEYRKPLERVLFYDKRDANPFFHLMEAMWILAAQQDVAFLKFFNGRMDEYSDDGVTFHAPYGYRLRKHFGKDQLESVIDHLSFFPESRQAVASIWDPNMDLNRESKDIPCNDLLMFKLRNGRLNLTVCNRSNDVIWGAYGANAVQFSFIHEYVTAGLSQQLSNFDNDSPPVEVGSYYQMSDSYHVYTEGPGGDTWADCRGAYHETIGMDPYSTGTVAPMPLIHLSTTVLDSDLRDFFTRFNARDSSPEIGNYTEPFMEQVVKPAFAAWMMWRGGMKTAAKKHVHQYVVATDWRMAMLEWMARRGA